MKTAVDDCRELIEFTTQVLICLAVMQVVGIELDGTPIDAPNPQDMEEYFSKVPSPRYQVSLTLAKKFIYG